MNINMIVNRASGRMSAGGSLDLLSRLYRLSSTNTTLLQYGITAARLHHTRARAGIHSLCTEAAYSAFREHTFQYSLTSLRNQSSRRISNCANLRNKSSFEPFNPDTSASIKMSSLHLGKGSACPPLKDGVTRLYNMKFCPFAQRALLVAEAKGISYEIVNCNLQEKPEWLLEKNPEGKVPILETKDGKVLSESLIVSDYLDEIYSQRPLHSKDAYKKSIDRIYIERFSSVVSMFYKIFFALGDPQPEVLKEQITNFVKSLKPFEEELTKRGSLFFGGEHPGMLDYMIWPWMERVPVIKSKLPDLFDYEAAKRDYPNLENWRQAMKKDAVVAKILISTDLHLKFIESFLASRKEGGTPVNYDL